MIRGLHQNRIKLSYDDKLSTLALFLTLPQSGQSDTVSNAYDYNIVLLSLSLFVSTKPRTILISWALKLVILD